LLGAFASREHEHKLKLELQQKMKIDVLTLFPAMFAGPLDESIIKRARKRAAGFKNP